MRSFYTTRKRNVAQKCQKTFSFQLNRNPPACLFVVYNIDFFSGTVLLRSSQPLIGSSGKRSRPDEKILDAVAVKDKKGFIFDTRSTGLVGHCKGKGGGTEPDMHYTQWQKIHKNLDKLVKCDGSVQEHFSKLIEGEIFNLNHHFKKN